MGKKKTETKVVNSVGFAQQPANPDFNTARSLVNNLDYQTPVREGFARQRNAIDESGNEFFGGNISDDLRTRIKSAQKFKSFTDEGEALSTAVGAENTDKINGYMSLGEATKPIFYNTGQTQTTTQGGNALGTVLGIAQTGAKFAAM